MRPPPFQPPTPGLARARSAGLSPLADLSDGVGAGPRISGPNSPGLESVGPRPEEVFRSAGEQKAGGREQVAPGRPGERPTSR